MVMCEIDASLARPVPGQIANIAGRIVCEAPVIDRDVEHAGQNPQRAKDHRARLLRRELGHPVLDF